MYAVALSPLTVCEEVKKMQKFIFNAQQGGKLYWFQYKIQVWLYVSLWENESTSHLIY